MAEQKTKLWYKRWWTIIIFIFIGLIFISFLLPDEDTQNSRPRNTVDKLPKLSDFNASEYKNYQNALLLKKSSGYRVYAIGERGFVIEDMASAFFDIIAFDLSDDFKGNINDARKITSGESVRCFDAVQNNNIDYIAWRPWGNSDSIFFMRINREEIKIQEVKEPEPEKYRSSGYREYCPKIIIADNIIGVVYNVVAHQYNDSLDDIFLGLFNTDGNFIKKIELSYLLGISINYGPEGIWNDEDKSFHITWNHWDGRRNRTIYARVDPDTEEITILSKDFKETLIKPYEIYNSKKAKIIINGENIRVDVVNE